MPGDWNGWTNSNGMGGSFDLIKITTGTTRWQTIFQYSGTTGNQSFKFVSGGGNPWHNQWAQNTNVSINQLNNFIYGTPSDPNNTITVTNGKWYTVNWRDNGYSNTTAIFMETSANPVVFTDLSFSPNSNIKPWETVTVTVTTGANPCAEEKIYLRYTTDNWSSSTLVQFTFSGNQGTAQIPAFTSGTNVQFYAYSTTLASDDIGSNHDMVTIRFINNGGSNYSYTVITPTNYQTTQNGNFSNSSTWVGGVVPPHGSSLTINHSLILNHNYTASSVTIGNSGQLVINSTETLTIETNGSWINNGSFTANSGKVVLQGNVTTGGNSSTTFYNVEIAGVDVSFDYSKSKISGVLEITTGSIANSPEFLSGSTLKYSQGGNYVRVTEWNNPWHVVVANNTNLDLNIAAYGGNLTVLGNLTIESGSTVDMKDATNKLIVNGDLNLQGTLILSTVVGGDLHLQGNWNRTGTFTHNSRLVLFSGSSTQFLNGHTTFSYITLNSGSKLTLNDGITVTDAFVVEGILNVGTQIINGSGSFTLQDGSTLVVGSLEGISSSGSNGNIQVTGSRTYSSNATYHYIGNDHQLSGNGFPTASGTKKIIIELGTDDKTFLFNTSAGITISSGGSLEIRRGILIEPDNPSIGRHVEGGGNLIMSGGEYQFLRVAKTTDVPRLSGTYSLTGGTIHLAASGNQKLRSGKTYVNLKFSGSDTVFISNTPDIGSITVTDSKILEIGNSSFGGTGTNLLMTGGRLRYKKVTGTLPEMTGTYSLTGGTIEFYGTSATQTQTLRNNVTYYDIEINATAANTTSGNVAIYGGGNISVSGTMRVKAPACLHLGTTSSSYVGGSGSFVLEAEAYLRLGQSLVAGTTAGNIRTAGKTFSSDAKIILHGNANITIDNPFPSSIRQLVVDKSAGSITLNQNLTIQENLTLTSGRILSGSNVITILNREASSILGGNSNSYVVGGTLVRAIEQNFAVEGKSTTYLFPIGTSDSYNPVTVEFTQLPITPGSLEVSFISTLHPNYTNSLPVFDNDQMVDNLSEKGYWQLIPDNLNNFSYNLTIQGSNFTDEPQLAINEPNKLRLVIRDDFNSPWKFLGAHGVGNASPPSVSRVGISDQFGIVAMGSKYSENPLPVELCSFEAQDKGQYVDLTWQTASEQNSRSFVVLRASSDGVFRQLDTIPAAGNSSTLLIYKYRDNTPRLSDVYYKLYQFDFNGEYTESQVVFIPYRSNRDAYIVNNILFCNLPNLERQQISYQISNLEGQIFQKGTITLNEPTIQIPLNTQPDAFIVSLYGNFPPITYKIINY